MKQKTKKALTHDIELIGKRVPVLAVAVLFLIAAGSAALLNNFGEITGEAEVDQAIQLEGEDGDYQVTLSGFDSGATAGDTVVDTVEIHNNLGEDYDLIFDSTLEIGDNEETIEDESGTQVDWEYEEEVFLNTTFANYFAQAGNDFDSYKAPDQDTDEGVYVVEDDQKINDVEPVENHRVVEDDVEIWADERALGVEELTVEASDVTISGFEFTEGQGVASADGDYSDVTVKYNTFDTDNWANVQTDASDWEWTNNRFEGENGIYLNTEEGDSEVIDSNTFYGVDKAIGVEGDGEVDVTGNYFYNSEEAIEAYDSSDVTISENRFEDNYLNIYSDSDETVDAYDNFFYDTSFNTEGDVDTSYSELDEVETGVTTLAVVNDFDVMTSGEFDYELNTTIE